MLVKRRIYTFVVMFSLVITTTLSFPLNVNAEGVSYYPIVPYTVGSTVAYELDNIIDNLEDSGRYYKITVKEKTTVNFFVFAEWDDTAAGLYDSNFDAIWNVTGDGTEGYTFTKPWIYDPSATILKYFYYTTTTLNKGTYYIGFANMDYEFFADSWVGLKTTIKQTECKIGTWHRNVKISGTNKVGKKLTAKYTKSKAVSGVKYSYTYKWYANGKVIKGATKSTYKIAKKYKGKKITVKVTCTAKVTNSNNYKLVGTSKKTVASKSTGKIK
jgi:hypothetical protein